MEQVGRIKKNITGTALTDDISLGEQHKFMAGYLPDHANSVWTITLRGRGTEQNIERNEKKRNKIK